MKTENQLITNHKALMKFEFWAEYRVSTLIHSIESNADPEVIREWAISKLIIDGDNVLAKWHKRPKPLSKAELVEEYGFKL